MEDAQVIHVLDVALLKVERHAALLGQEVQRVERLGLRLADGRDARTPRGVLVSGEASAGVLDDDALRCAAFVAGLMPQQRPDSIWPVGVPKSEMFT